MYVYDIKIFAKNENEMETVKRIGIYSQYIRFEISIETCTMLVMKSGKRWEVQVKGLPNEDVSREGKNQVFGNVASGHYQ